MAVISYGITGPDTVMATGPIEVLSGASIGQYCDACPRRFANGDRVVGYATKFPGERWRLRRIWCRRCGDRTLSNDSGNVEEALLTGVIWRNQFVAVQPDRPSDPG